MMDGENKTNPLKFQKYNLINLVWKYEKQGLIFFMEKGTSKLTQNAEFISGGLILFAKWRK